ncbi:hypothetical protein E4O03_09435 [Treponema sp. OMZ 792]|uniref:hypothetical protein n=1 Tax=unclassified Treponema TaxID=2638727 RepID=UPI0020A28C26|nr:MULTISPECIES: hypothetical protein [unclassified Treponema]UTC74433.1 hypothetical protein E4O03_09435 [Treponema sp. OMZ 792]UTC77289.1 hypothetical protein E4O04_04410 [Treponema sp. OMZ 799]UTC80830.1 hypothetical protein E4O07_09340 [Treponema sp. OMZ 798]
MKKNYKLLILMSILVPIFFASCASKQKAQEILPEPKVEEVKTPAVETEKPKQETVKPEVPKADPLLAELKLFQGQNGKVNKARKKAVELGADKAYTELFQVPEALKQKADSDAQAGNYKAAIAKYNEAIIRYDTLSNLMNASSLRAEIESNNFGRYSPADYVDAERFSINTIDHYRLDHKMAKEASEDAVKLYKKVAAKGYLEFTKTAKDTAKEYKDDCDSIKAARSRKEEYNKAVRTYNKGKSAADRADYKEAYISYNEAAKLFAKLYEEVSLKRAEAEKAMAEAAMRQQESSDLALEADKEAPLTEAGEGFTEGELDLQNLSTPQTGAPVENINTQGDEPANTENNQTTAGGGQ